MIDKHELLGFECLESRHTFAVEDVALIEFTTTDGRSGHFWYDSHLDPSPYEGVVVVDAPRPRNSNWFPIEMYDRSVSGTDGRALFHPIDIQTETEFAFDTQVFENAQLRAIHGLFFDYEAWKIALNARQYWIDGDTADGSAGWQFIFTEYKREYLSDVVREPILPDSLLSLNLDDFRSRREFGWVNRPIAGPGTGGSSFNQIEIATIKESPVLDLSLSTNNTNSHIHISADALNIDSRVTVNEFQPDDDVRFYWSSNETTAGIISEVPSEIFGQSAANRYSTTFSASIDSIQTLIPSNANSIIAIIDNNDNILEKNEFNNVLAVPLSEFLVDDGSVQLSYDSLGRLYADGQAVRIQNQYAASAIGGFEVVSATDEGGNQLIVERDSTQYRLIADDVWRINGLFNSLQNESASIIDVSARESPSTLNISAVAGAYEINGVNNPTLVVRRGQTYTFNLNTAGHPFYLQTTGGGYQSTNIYADGFTGNNRTSGEYRWVVPQDAPDEIFYQCKFHPVMFGKIIVVD